MGRVQQVQRLVDRVVVRDERVWVWISLVLVRSFRVESVVGFVVRRE